MDWTGCIPRTGCLQRTPTYYFFVSFRFGHLWLSVGRTRIASSRADPSVQWFCQEKRLRARLTKPRLGNYQTMINSAGIDLETTLKLFSILLEAPMMANGIEIVVQLSMVDIHEICQCFTDHHSVCNLSIMLQYTSISHPHVKIHFLALWVKDSFNSIGCVKDSASAPSFLGLVGGCPGVSSFRSMVHRTRYSLSTGLLTPWSAWWWCGWPSSYCFLSLVWTGHLEENIRICRNEYAETSVTVAHGKVEVDSVVARHKWMEWKYKMRGWHEMYAACNRSCIRMRFSRGVRRQELPDHGCCLWASFADLRHEPLWPKMIQRCLR